MDALGDSTTRGYGTNGSPSDYLPRSYSTGTDPVVNSLYQRFLSFNPAIAGQTFNHAADGSKMGALNAQVQAAVTADVEFVTVMIGAADVCLASTEAQMTSVSTYRTQFEQAMSTLAAGLPEARVFVLSVPDAYRTWEVLKDDPAAHGAWSSHSFCDVLFDNPLSTDPADVARRNAFRQRMVDYNAQLEEVCALYSQCTFDDNTLFDLGFEAADISTVDYVHPSTQWHAKVAEALWPLVGPPNQPPTADAGPDQTVAHRVAFTLDASGSSDGDDDPLTYHWTQVGATNAVIHDEDETTPDAQVDGVKGPATLTFEVAVTDIQGDTDTDEIVVTVNSK